MSLVQEQSNQNAQEKVKTDKFKSVVPTAIDAIANAATLAAKNKVSGMGAKKRKPGRPLKERGGGALLL